MSRPLRVALLTPFSFPSVRGNAVTVDRITRSLADGGIGAAVWDLSVTPEADVERAVAAFQPDVVHAFHAYRVGPLALRVARRADVPLVVTLTGTDANHDLFDPERAPVVRRVLEGAARVTAFHASIATRVTGVLPVLDSRFAVVPQAVRLEREAPFDLATRWRVPPGRRLFLFPAGIRPVKNPRFPLTALGSVVDRFPDVRLLYAGPVLDPEEGDVFRREMARCQWACHVGAVPHAQMASLLSLADVVLNCSFSEGGMANSVLEAFALERAVLASDIEGNRSLVEHGVTGLLFADAAGFAEGAEALAADAALRARLGHAGRALVERLYSPARERDGYLDVYRQVAAVPSA